MYTIRSHLCERAGIPGAMLGFDGQRGGDHGVRRASPVSMRVGGLTCPLKRTESMRRLRQGAVLFSCCITYGKSGKEIVIITRLCDTLRGFVRFVRGRSGRCCRAPSSFVNN